MRRSLRILLGGGGALLLAVAGYAGLSFVGSAPPAPAVADGRYGPADAQRFDVWKPAGAGPFPVVLAVHGGPPIFGDKRGHDELRPGIDALLPHGIVVASTNSRMSGEARFPAAAQDITAALPEARRRAQLLSLNPDRVALGGKSADASLALLVGLAAGRLPTATRPVAPVRAIVAMYPPTRSDVMDEQLRALSSRDGAAAHSDADSSGSVWLGGALVSRPQQVAASSPLTYATPAAPPVLVQAGLAHCTVPHQQSEMLAASLRKAGAPVRLDLVPGAKHSGLVFGAPPNLSIVVAFLEKALSNPTAQARH